MEVCKYNIVNDGGGPCSEVKAALSLGGSATPNTGHQTMIRTNVLQITGDALALLKGCV